MGSDALPAEGLPEPAGLVGPPNVSDLPSGYRYGITRYADIILREALPARFADLVAVLSGFRLDVDELTRGGGSRATQTIRFDNLLLQRGWGKRNVTIAKLIDDTMIHSTRGHEIDMFGVGSSGDPYPGVAVEMEWNNKDPFFDRDLVNFSALHREGALAIGVIVTRGPTLGVTMSRAAPFEISRRKRPTRSAACGPSSNAPILRCDLVERRRTTLQNQSRRKVKRLFSKLDFSHLPRGIGG